MDLYSLCLLPCHYNRSRLQGTVLSQGPALLKLRVTLFSLNLTLLFQLWLVLLLWGCHLSESTSNHLFGLSFLSLHFCVFNSRTLSKEAPLYSFTDHFPPLSPKAGECDFRCALWRILAPRICLLLHIVSDKCYLSTLCACTCMYKYAKKHFITSVLWNLLFPFMNLKSFLRDRSQRPYQLPSVVATSQRKSEPLNSHSGWESQVLPKQFITGVNPAENLVDRGTSLDPDICHVWRQHLLIFV